MVTARKLIIDEELIWILGRRNVNALVVSWIITWFYHGEAG